jgi:O-antigen/teichoic acid export membrane protein
MGPLASILRNWSLLAGAYLASSLIAMVFMLIVSRTLGDVEFGRLYLALTLTTILGVAADLGLSQLVTRAVSRDRALARSYFWRAAPVIAGVCACLYVALLGIAQVLGYTQEVRTLVIILGFVMVADGFSQLLGALYQAHERMVIPALTRVAANVFAIVLVLTLLSRGSGAVVVAIVLTMSAGARLTMQAFAAGRLEGMHLPAPPAPPWPVLVRAGLPFLAAQGLALCSAKVDVLILGGLVGEATVGWYAAASRLMDSFNVIPLVMIMAIFPVLSRLWVRAPSEFGVTVEKTFHVLVVVTVPISVTLCVLAEDLVGVLFTLESYAPAVPILRIQAVSLALVFVDYLLSCTLMSCGRERTWLKILGVAVVANVAVNWLLIPWADAAYANGAIGAALATLLTEIFILVSAVRALPRGTLGVTSLQVAGGSWALGAGLAAALLAGRMIGMPWLAAAVLGGIGYLATATALGILPADLIRWIRGLVLAARRPRPTTESEMHVRESVPESQRTADVA